MHFLRNYNHDFPRLAKQSGFFFQLCRGRVNWSEIESLNLDDITENRNFELLEKNLLNVINCNLERDYDLKILDQNFVKLFKLAQLGIDYLSYCELYLDRCVILLQEQLISVQEEYESLKNENEGKNLELKKVKSKKKVNNYQCDKCEKVFISDVYLKFHDKRRHSNLSTPQSEENLFKKTIDASQQTESEMKLSVSIQTLFDEADTSPQKNEEIRKIKRNHNKKIKRLEKNLNDIKARLQKTEKSLQETKEVNFNSAPVGFPPSIQYHPVLQFMPPCFPESRESIAEYQKTLQKNQPTISSLVADVDSKIAESYKSPVSSNAFLKTYNDHDNEKTMEASKINLLDNKENINPQDVKAVVPIPPPRKTKTKLKNDIRTEENFKKTYNQLTDSSHSVTTIVPFSNQLVDSTSVKRKSDIVVHSENLEVKAEKANSHETLNINREKTEEELKSFFKKVVGQNPPKLQKFTKNLKRPLTNLYDSVSSSGKHFMKLEKKFQSTKNVLIDDLNNQLLELGVDPEWKGIPKKTMKEKLKNLTYRRKLLSKGNPLYNSVRQSAEEKIFEKLKKNIFTRNPLQQKPQKPRDQQEEEEILPVDENPCRDQGNVQDRNSAILYDTDEESRPRTPGFEKNQLKQSPLVCVARKERKASGSDSEEDAVREGGKKFDIHVFQVKAGNMNKQEKPEKVTKLNEVEVGTNSDSEEDFSIPSDNDEFFKTIYVNANVKNNYGK